MKILQILPELNVGGVETGTVDFGKYLIANGHESVVVSHGGKLVQDLEKSGSTHYTLPVHKKSLWTAWKMVGKVREIIQKENVDIVHARSRVPGWIAFFACRGTNASFITTCHGYYHSRMFSQVMGWSKLVIVPSEVIGRHMIDHYKVPAERIRRIPRSVDLDKFKNIKSSRKNTKTKTIAIIGRITPLKGHTYFFQAMAKVMRETPNVRFWVIGDFPANKDSYKQEIETLIRRLGLKEHVEFLGSRKDIPELLSQIDLLVFSSVVPESFGRVILEAQAAGVPVVATKVGGVIDIIDHEKTGLLVRPKHPEAIAKQVLRLLKDKKLTNTLCAQAKDKLKSHFTLEHMASRTLEVYNELLESMHILVIKISSVGDVILATASLKAIREKFPQAKIHCLVGKNSRKVLHNCPYVDDFIVYDPKGKDKGWRNLWKLSKRLRKYKFDKVIDFQNNRRSHLLAFLSVPQESYGYRNGKWGFLLTNGIKNDVTDIPPVPHQFQVLSKLGIRLKEHHYLELWPSEKEKRYAKSLLESEWLGNTKNIVGINLAASEKWPTKNWPIEYIAELCDLLSSKNLRVIITGMEKDRPLARKLLSLTKSKPALLIGKTDILQLAALIKRCRVYITPDSAPMHVAAAMQTPILAFFGPTSSTRHIPPAKKIVVLEKKLTCAPCYSSHCRIFTHACMKDISPEEVFKEVEHLVGDVK